MLPPLLRQMFPVAEMLATLEQYQLFGQVSENPSGYIVVVEFRGRTGAYTLPDEVQDIVIVR